MKSAFAGLVVMALAAGSADAGESGRPRAVVELFTSQGCSSCPPADHLLGELARDPSVIALTLPVTYWDYLGWKDTLGSKAHSARQKAYSMARGDRKIYTPQVIVNGTVPAIGNDPGAVDKAINDAKGNAEGLSVDVTVEEDEDRIKVRAGAPGEGAESGEIWLLATAAVREVTIARGENQGRTVPYVNVVRKMTRLGPWTGKSCAYSIGKSEALAPDGDGYVVLVQAGTGGNPGRILGAAQARR
jgi:hypothetical protein